MSQTYDLVMTSDEIYTNYLFVLCHNILERIDKTKDNSQDNLVFHVIIDETVPLAEFEAKTKLFEQFHQDAAIAFNFETHVVNPSDLERFNSLPNPQLISHTNNNTHPAVSAQIKTINSMSFYYRLLMDRLLSKDVSKVFYLDLDTYVYCDIREIFEVQLGDNILGVVQDLQVDESPTLADAPLVLEAYDPEQPDFILSKKDYFNSGILVVNLTAWREHNVTERCIEAGNKWRFFQRDQTMLNIICQNQVTHLDWYWNANIKIYFLLSALACKSTTPQHEYANSFFKVPVHMQDFFSEANKTRIVHFCGGLPVKPWYYQFRLDKVDPVIKDSILFKVMNARQLWLASLQQLTPFFKACKQLPCLKSNKESVGSNPDF